MMIRNRKLIIIIAAFFSLALIAAAIFGGIGLSKRQVYTENIALGNKYYASGDYESAIMSYTKALEADPENADSYIGLIRAYIANFDLDLAWNIYQKGLIYCTNFDNVIPAELKAALQGGKLNSDKSDGAVSLNTYLLNMVSGNTFNDYRVRNGIQSSDTKSDGSVNVRISGIAANFLFANTDQQKNAVNTVNKTVNFGAVPISIVLDSPSVLFGADNVTYGQLKTLPVLNLKYNNNLVTFSYNMCSVKVTTDGNGNVKPDSVCTLVPNIASDTSKKGNSAVSGIIVDATTGRPVSMVTMKFRNGDSRTGSVVETVKTDASGRYECSLVSGNYTVEMSHSGYITEYADLYVGTYQDQISQNFSISPELAAGEIRIVLQWNSVPKDLDSYLDGNGCSVNFSSPNCKGIAELDVDDMDGYGPETITIHDVKGSYHYYVDDFNDSGALTASGAIVKVYIGGEVVETISISSAKINSTSPEAIWSVLFIDNGKITVDNTVVAGV